MRVVGGSFGSDVQYDSSRGDVLDTADSSVDDLHLRLDNAIVAARYLYEMHPYPATAGPMYGQLRDALRGLSGEIAKMRAAAAPTAPAAPPPATVGVVGG
jgi:hypothetical protein